MIQMAKLNVTASDVTGQRNASLTVPVDFSIGELADGLLPRLRINQNGRDGAPVQYDVRLERENRHVHRGEIVGDVLRPDDHLVFHPRIMAGRGSTAATTAK